MTLDHALRVIVPLGQFHPLRSLTHTITLYEALARCVKQEALYLMQDLTPNTPWTVFPDSTQGLKE